MYATLTGAAIEAFKEELKRLGREVEKYQGSRDSPGRLVLEDRLDAVYLEDVT